MDKSWNKFFEREKEQEYFKNLLSRLDEEYNNKIIYPEKENLFRAFKETKLDDVKVVILGQDPYHEEQQATGLAFSVPGGLKLPPSLKNIFQEIENEYNYLMLNNGDLTYLARQGVLLINAFLSVEAHKPLSHHFKEYEIFISHLFSYLNNVDHPIVYMLWGNFAKKFAKLISNPNHLVIKRNHPSPLSANKGGWFNQNTFIECDNFLLSKGLKPIDWKNY
ncbi:MAG: uracil-DNA glycosylase [Erysipelotrichaceae bacterium]|nr:uracil-DNA glycosylase [Erysipelotrichaceae bacterium]